VNCFYLRADLALPPEVPEKEGEVPFNDHVDPDLLARRVGSKARFSLLGLTQSEIIPTSLSFSLLVNRSPDAERFRAIS
jgi:hypothetical protein